MIILKLLMLILLLLAVPYMTGLVVTHFIPNEYKSIGFTFLLGFITMLVLLEIVGIPIEMCINYSAYYIFMAVYGAVLLIVSIVGICLQLKNRSLKGNLKSVPECSSKLSLESIIYLILILAAIGFQLVMVFLKSSMDADDFYYNAQALSAQNFGTMYRIDADTGWSFPLDMRHAMALFPMLEAFISSLSGLHVLIITHRVMPIILIPLSYYLCYLIGKHIFPEKMEKRLIFVFLLNVWRVFGFVSYYTTETFFLLRTWQGKSVAGNIIFPGIVLIYLIIKDRNVNVDDATDGCDAKKTGIWYIILAMFIFASGAASSFAVLISVSLTGLLGLIFFIMDKDRKTLLYTILSIIPGCVYILLYAIMA